MKRFPIAMRVGSRSFAASQSDRCDANPIVSAQS